MKKIIFSPQYIHNQNNFCLPEITNKLDLEVLDHKIALLQPKHRMNNMQDILRGKLDSTRFIVQQ